MSEEKSTQVTTIISAFAVGALVGAATAVLFAPRAGKETRLLLAQKTGDIREKVSEALSEAKDALSQKKAEIMAAVEACRKKSCDESEEDTVV
ncbi:MAG: YtxH domain-containing protein [Victivallales bacterium]|nr:YtxH domain-containing protein [Victivallales bacterium]